MNELLGTRLASRLKLPTVPVEVIYVSPELIRLTPDLCIELPRSRMPCVPGPQFGSRYPGDPRELTLHDFLPDEKLREVTNIGDFAGMLVFDKWTCNTNGRQTLFFEENKRRTGESLGNLPPPSPGSGEPATLPYKTVMIDQGFCFNAGNWDFPDAPLRGLYARNRVYDGVTGMGRSRHGWIGCRTGSPGPCSPNWWKRFRRSGTRTITTRCCGCSTNCSGARGVTCES